jgi:hypothetical protein
MLGRARKRRRRVYEEIFRCFHTEGAAAPQKTTVSSAPIERHQPALCFLRLRSGLSDFHWPQLRLRPRARVAFARTAGVKAVLGRIFSRPPVTDLNANRKVSSDRESLFASSELASASSADVYFLTGQHRGHCGFRRWQKRATRLTWIASRKLHRPLRSFTRFSPYFETWEGSLNMASASP